MEYDLKSLQVFIEQRFEASDSRQLRQHSENQTALAELTKQVRVTNDRVGKMEITQAVLKFAVFTIGGSLLAALIAVALQVLIARLNG